jgi:hypothetical protein
MAARLSWQCLLPPHGKLRYYSCVDMTPLSVLSLQTANHYYIVNSWLRHYASSRKVAGSSPDEVIGFFNWPNPSSRIMVLVSTRPLTEMSTRNLPGGKGRPTCKADKLTAICQPIVSKMWEPRRLTTLRASTACYRDSFTFTSTFWRIEMFPSSGDDQTVIIWRVFPGGTELNHGIHQSL